MPDVETVFEHARLVFFSRVAVAGNGECWRWTARLLKSGYGAFSVNGKEERAHRVAWALVNGSIPLNAHVLHHCDNPPCCNPAHLFLGDPTVNARDRAAKGRSAVGERHGSRTHPESVPHLIGESNPSAKVTVAQVRAIRAAYTGTRGEITDFARKHGLTASGVWRIVHRKNWACA